MTEQNYRAMYQAARDEAEKLRAELRRVEGELTAERLAAEQAKGNDPWHVLTGGRKVEGFALSCDCAGCAETRRLAGVKQLQQKIRDAEAVARNAAPAEREKTHQAEKRANAAEHQACEANRRADAAERQVKQLTAEAERQRGRADAGNARANEALRASERAIERTARARGRYRKLEAAARRTLELAPYVRAALRGGRAGASAVREARAAVELLRRGES